MPGEATKREVVSSESESLIRVNSADEPLGFLGKTACHDGHGVLHRAFSIFVLDTAGDLLMQRRHPTKRLWPGYWSNSCCSHPSAGEEMDVAVERRLEQELGLFADLQFAFKFEYCESFKDKGTEHELCWVYVGRTDSSPIINTTEISEWRWIDPDKLDAELTEHPEEFTPWLKIEWQQLRDGKKI